MVDTARDWNWQLMSVFVDNETLAKIRAIPPPILNFKVIDVSIWSGSDSGAFIIASMYNQLSPSASTRVNNVMINGKSFGRLGFRNEFSILFESFSIMVLLLISILGISN